MDGSSGTADYADSPQAGAENTEAEFEPPSANGSEEALRDVIGRNVMTWIGAGTAQHCEAESGRDHKLKARFS